MNLNDLESQFKAEFKAKFPFLASKESGVVEWCLARIKNIHQDCSSKLILHLPKKSRYYLEIMEGGDAEFFWINIVPPNGIRLIFHKCYERRIDAVRQAKRLTLEFGIELREK